MLNREERQFIYRWFNTMLARELSDEQLNVLQAGQFEDFFVFLRELGFETAVAKFQTELTACRELEFPRLELAADFAQLFLLDGQQSALPYASAYLEEKELTQNLVEMDHLLSQFSLQVNRETKEPSDHICVYLGLLDTLLEKNDIQESYRFIREQLYSWLPQWVEKSLVVKSKTQFYQSVLVLFKRFVEFELAEIT